VAFELGSRWGAKRHLVPLLTPDVTASALKGALASLNAVRIDDRAQMQQLITDLASELGIKARSPHQYDRQLERLLTGAARRSRPGAAEVAAAIDRMAPTTDDFLGEWSWIFKDVEFIITFRRDGTFVASSEKGADRFGLFVHNFNGIWSIKDAHLEVTQTHYSVLGVAREHPDKWIDSVVASATRAETLLTEIRFQDGTRLRRVASE
jgi:hypothetical protein